MSWIFPHHSVLCNAR